jgi:hypothetical protein
MSHALPGVFAAVRDYTETFFEPELLRKLSDNFVDMRYYSAVFAVYLRQLGNMFLRYHEKMHRRFGVDIAEGVYGVVFVQYTFSDGYLSPPLSCRTGSPSIMGPPFI